MRGNRHVGGCCGGHGLKEKPHPEHQRSRSPTDRKRKKKQAAFVSPSRKYAQMNEEREEEFRNYKGLVEQRFTQMLEDEKCKLKQQFAEKRDLLEKKVRFENEERLREIQDQMKSEFGHQQRIAEQRHYDEMMQKERDLKNKLEQEQRRMELESIHREQALEEKVQNRLNQQNERFGTETQASKARHDQEKELLRREMENRLAERLSQEQQRLEADFRAQRDRMEED